MRPKYSMTPKQSIFFAKRNLVDYIWKSANLEGIGVTYPDTQTICDGLSVNGYRIEEINAINDLKHAWQYVLGNISEPLDFDYICRIHMLLGKFTIINAGFIRRREVRIGGTDWVPAIPKEGDMRKEIEKIMHDDAEAQDKALNLLLYLVRKQAFYDGNKRIAMLSANKVMIEHGMGIISVNQENTKCFYELLIQYYETGDGAKLKQFLYDKCIDGMDF